MAIKRSPAAAAALRRAEAVRTRQAPAGALPDPMIEMVLQNAGVTSYSIGREEMSMIGVQVRQELPYPGKRAARAEIVRAEAAVRQAEAELVMRRIARDVRTLYARLYALDREAETLQAAGELLDLLAATVRARYVAGVAEQEAVLKNQLEVSRLAERADDLRLARAESLAELNRWLDLPGEAEVGEVEELPAPIEPPESLELLEEASPEVAVARAVVAAAAERLAAARLDLKPDFNGAAGLGVRGALDPVVTLSFGIQLPFWKEQKQRREIEAAALELEAAQRDLQDVRAMVRSELARLASARAVADRQVVLYREAILPRTSAALDAARAAYLAGRGDFSSVIEDFELWLEARVELARRESDAFVARAEIARIVGAGPEGGPPLSAAAEEEGGE